MRCFAAGFWQRTVSKMMKKLFLLLGVLFFIGCSTLDLNTDYDVSYDFSKVKTFAVVHEKKEGESTITNDRIMRGIKKALHAKGFKETDSKSVGLVFLFHLDVTNKTDIYTDYQMVGYGRYGGMVISTPRSYNYDEGKLIIDAYDPKLNKTVYRVIAIDEIKHKKTPQERDEYVDEAIAKALKSFPPEPKKR